MSIKINKNGKEYPLGFMPEHYPADRVYLDGDTSKTVQNPTFTEASTRANIVSGESFATILGKIKKWFTDLPSMFVSKSGDTVNGLINVRNSNGDTQINAYKPHNGTTSQESLIVIGNNIPSGSAGCSRGVLGLFGNGAYRTDIKAPDSTANRYVTFPDKSGTLSVYENVVKINSNVDVYLYRNGNLRTLDIRGAQANAVVGLTIPLGDRPSDTRVFSILWFGFIGRLAINSNGAISLGHYPNYGVNTLSNDDTSTVTVRATVTWAVD